MLLVRDKNYHSSIILPLLFILTLSCYSFISFSVFRTIAYADSSTQTMYRLYNPNSGEHFWTASEYERDNVLNAGWLYEGIGWYAPVKSSTPVYRLYNPNAPYGDHHYTMSKHEYDTLVKIGWRGEGIGWYSDDNKGSPVYRVYRPGTYTFGSSGAHHFTSNITEAKYLINLGWNDEHISWYGLKHDNTNTNNTNNNVTGDTIDDKTDSLKYSYELRALSTKTYLMNQEDNPHAVFYLRTDQPDYTKIYYYDSKDNQYHQIEPIDLANDTQDKSNSHFVDSEQLQGYIVNMPYGTNISLYEEIDGKKIKINDVNIPDGMIEEKDYNTSMTEWLETIKTKYEENIENQGLNKAPSMYKFYNALSPLLEEIMENTYTGYFADSGSYRDRDNYRKYGGSRYYHSDLLETIDNSSLFNDKDYEKYPELWFVDHQKCWEDTQRKVQLFETIIKYVMGDEIEETLAVYINKTNGVISGNNYIEYEKEGYQKTKLYDMNVYVRFKDDNPNAPYYFINAFNAGIDSLLSTGMNNHERFSKETMYFEDYQEQVNNKIFDDTRIIWNIAN